MKTIGVIGASETSTELYEFAVSVGREIAKRNCILICGGLTGIMEGASKGAKLEGGTTVGILPGYSINEANHYIDIPIVTGLSHGRNIIVVRSSNAIISIAGSYGTLSEIAFALTLNIPVVGINTWEVSSDIISASTPKEAVDMAYNLANGINP